MKDFVFNKVAAYSLTLLENKHIHGYFSKTLLNLLKPTFCRVSLWWLFLSLDKSSRSYESCIKQTPSIKFSILINDSDLRYELRKTSENSSSRAKAIGL